MSKEELNSLKEEIFLTIRQLEDKVFENINVKTAQLSDDFDKFKEKLEIIISNNKSMVESVVSEKIKAEKLTALESFKNRAEGVLLSHELKINEHNKNITYMKNKYDKAIEDNLLVPGLIGPKCQFNNIKEYINSNNSEIARLKYEKDQLKSESKDYKSRFDGLLKQMINIVDNSVENLKKYINEKISETKIEYDKKIEESDERAKDLRLEIREIKNDIEIQVNDLKLETQKMDIFSEQNKKLEESIIKINNQIEKTNYEINKLFEKNKNIEKKYSEFKNELSRIKVMTEIKNKTRNKTNIIKTKEPMATYTVERKKRENNLNDSYKDKIYSEKRNLSAKKKKYFDTNEQKYGFNINIENKEEMKNSNKIKNLSKSVLNRKPNLKTNIPINNKEIKDKYNHTNDDDFEEKEEEKINSTISEESIPLDKEKNNILNLEEYQKVKRDSTKFISRNEDIINVNPNFKEYLTNTKDNATNTINYIEKKPELYQRRISEIKFDVKTNSLRKITYNITRDQMFFPKIHRHSQSNSIDFAENFIIENNPKVQITNNNIDDDNTISSESIHNENKKTINKEIINNENNKEYINNKNERRRSTINSQNEIEKEKIQNNILSRMESIKSLNENIEQNNNIPSYRSSNKNFIDKNNPLKNDKSPRHFEVDKYLLNNIKKGKKILNLSKFNDKYSNVNNINSNINYLYTNYHNNNISPLHNSQNRYNKGINLVGLNDEYTNRINSMDGLADIHLSGQKGNNLKLERLGKPSANTKNQIKKKFKLQGISNEAPLKISAAFGRTAYTFIDKNNEKKIYSIQMIKKKPENEKLDIFFGAKG